MSRSFIENGVLPISLALLLLRSPVAGVDGVMLTGEKSRPSTSTPRRADDGVDEEKDRDPR